MKLPAKVKSVVDCATDFSEWTMTDNERETTYTYDIVAPTNIVGEYLPIGISIIVSKGEA